RYHRNLRFFKEWDNEDVMQVYLTALAHVYDPHSDYFNASGSDNFSIGMSLSLFGIGAQLKSEDGYCTIDKLLPGGPAAKSGKIKERDRVVAVAQGDGPFEDVVEMSLNKAVRLIRGAKGSEVRLVLMPASDPTSRQTLALIRDEIKLEDQEAKARIIDMPVGDGKAARVGVIDLPSFYATVDLTGERRNSERRSSTADVARLLKKLEAEKVEGVILDLRRNGGGSLEEAIGITGLFIKSGPVVQAKGPGKDSPVAIEEDRDGGKQLYDGPLILLTSRGTASASEIVAGALQDYGRALIVGDISTHGKGTVQNLNPLTPYVRPATPSATNDPGTLKLTIRKFYRAGGASTQLKGVMPDIVLPSILNVAKDVGERAQENALEWDTLPSTKFDRVNLVAPYLAELLRRSNGRVATNRDFVYVREDIEKFRARQEDKTVSLNERERLQEKETDDTRQKARKQELLARHEPPATVYELTLRLADQPGLPPAVEKTNSSVAKVSAPATGFGTNSASLTPRPVRRDVGLEGDDEELDPPAVDVALEEAEHIMLDYVGLAHKGFVSLAH
ncbi:MAG: tail-specific protease, partial [Verrucomicrobia bacterium]